MRNLERNVQIDIMKGIAILTVIVGHYWSPSILKYIIWSFHMPLFVVLSGLFIKKDFGKERIRKIAKGCLIPYTVVYGVNNVVFICSNYIHGYKIDLKNIVLSYIYAIGSNTTPFKPEQVTKVGVIWFLMALFISKTIIIFIITKTKKSSITFFIILILCFIAIILYKFCCLPFGILNGISFMPWLYLGYSFGNIIDKKIIFKKRCYILCSLCIWCVVLSYQYHYKKSYSITDLSFPDYLVGLFGACAAIYLIYCCVFANIKMMNKKMLVNIGNSTIWILCIHGIDIEQFSNIFAYIYIKFHFRGIGIAIMAIRLLIDISVGLLLKKIYGKMKYLKASEEKYD